MSSAPIPTGYWYLGLLELGSQRSVVDRMPLFSPCPSHGICKTSTDPSQFQKEGKKLSKVDSFKQSLLGNSDELRGGVCTLQGATYSTGYCSEEPEMDECVLGHSHSSQAGGRSKAGRTIRALRWTAPGREPCQTTQLCLKDSVQRNSLPSSILLS